MKNEVLLAREEMRKGFEEDGQREYMEKVNLESGFKIGPSYSRLFEGESSIIHFESLSNFYYRFYNNDFVSSDDICVVVNFDRMVMHVSGYVGPNCSMIIEDYVLSEENEKLFKTDIVTLERTEIVATSPIFINFQIYQELERELYNPKPVTSSGLQQAQSEPVQQELNSTGSDISQNSKPPLTKNQFLKDLGL